MKVLVTDKINESAGKIIEPAAEVDFLPTMSEEELIKIIPNYEALMVRSQTKVTANIINAGVNLRIIGRAGVGVDNIDLEAATQKGIIVVNSPDGNTMAASEHTIALMLAMARNVAPAATSTKEGKWERSKFVGTELYKKTLGIIGFGKIGSHVGEVALALGMKVVVNTHHEKWLESRPTYSFKEENNNRLRLLWTQIAHAFKDYDYDLAFAGTNEVHMSNNWNAPTAENLDVQNSYNQTFVDAVRATGGNNVQRHLIVQTYNTSIDFGLNGFVVPTDVAGNGKDYMSVEVHYYTPWDYCGACTYYYWGQSYKQYGPIPSYDEQTMRNDFQRIAQTWGQQGLGIVIGEWGVSDHYTTVGRKAIIHENMTYYCKTLVNEARQRGFSTFVWDNNVYGNGEERFGIFDRKNDMALTADWIVQGIMNGVATDIRSVRATVAGTDRTAARLFIDKGRVVILKGDKRYNLKGIVFEN